MACAMELAQDLAAVAATAKGHVPVSYTHLVVMDRRALEDALLHAAALANLVVPHLQDDAQALDEEDATEMCIRDRSVPLHRH